VPNPLRTLPLAAALAAVLLAACGRGDAPRAGGGAGERPLLVLAAADLQLALPEIAHAFEARTGIPVDLVLGSTGNLTTQIENGAPADVFLAADLSFIGRLERGGVVAEGSRRVYAVGRLALVWRAGAPPPADVAALASAAYRTVAIANPEHAPYGRAAREALEASAAWTAVRPRLVVGENVAQAMQFVRTGNADAGLVALGVAIGQREVPYRVVDAALHAPLLQAGAVLGESRRPGDAAAFLEEVAGAAGQRVLRRYGFEAPEAP
jgi:molybdate transport system substrate-binding protein